MSETDEVLAEPERNQLLQMLVNFEQSLLGEVGEVRKMITLVRNGGVPEEIIHVVPPTGAAVNPDRGDA